MNKWLKIACLSHELNLDVVLSAGQSFRWCKTNVGEWSGVLGGRVYTLSQNDTHLLYRVYHKGHRLSAKWKNKGSPASLKTSPKVQKKNICEETEFVNRAKPKIARRKNVKKIGEIDVCHDLIEVKLEHDKDCQNENTERDREILYDYFQLDWSLQDLYSQWTRCDGHFKCIAEKYTGIRQLRQDPVENLFSFICSSNNNITRISGMVEKMCERYGDELAEVDGRIYHTFPTIEVLAGPGVEDTLRQLGFGYRAKYISETAKYIHSQHSSQWLYELRNRPYQEARQELLRMCGVGPKVSDCVCLMSLDKHGAVPIDTHVFQFALRDYGHYPAIAKYKTAKSVTDKVYKDIGDFFRGLWGTHAGWAQSVLFSAELPQFKDTKKSDKTKKQKRKPAERGENIPKKKAKTSL